MKGIIFYLFLLPVFVFGQTTKEVVIHSKQLQSDRKIWINTPKNYELKKDKLHLVILLDGDNSSLFDFTVASKRFLEENSVDLSDYKTPQSLIVGIQQSKDRWEDFADSDNSAKFLSFLEKEVLPFIQENYRVENYRILIGHSLGGRFAINVLLNRPELFNAIIAASPAVSKDDIAKTLAKFDTFFKSSFTYDKALYFSTTYLKGDSTEEGFREFSEALNKYLANKKLPNFRFKFNSSDTLGHGKSPFFAIPEGFHFIYSPSLWQLEPDSLFSKGTSPILEVQKYEQRIKQKFGILISTHIYAPILADELIKENKINEAIDLMKKEIDADPTDLDLFAQLLAVLKKNNKTEYNAYKAKFVEILGKLRITQTEQNEWFEWIEKNSQ